MDLRVESGEGGFVLVGSHGDVPLVNRFLQHLAVRNFAVATVRAYAYDLLNLLRFLTDRHLRVVEVVAADVFDYLEWQRQPVSSVGRKVVRLNARSGAAPATMNRRIAAARGLFEFAVLDGVRPDSPVPAARRTVSPRAKRRGLLGHVGSVRSRAGGRLVRQPRRLPDALENEEVAAFFADLETYRDRAIVLAMLWEGCARVRCGACAWPMWIRAVGGCEWWARATVSASFRSTGPSSSSSPRTCGRSGR